VFGLIDKAAVKRAPRDGRIAEVEITLSDWLLNAVNGNEVLTSEQALLPAQEAVRTPPVRSGAKALRPAT